ncbi:hypothetical protein DVH24_039893 [Malus domestica]|uniref:Peptidase A1 domain-containing protein n=1 Tax=Malus domestica TaxID=3750 RepID=A0A498I6S6_MALDO|nr:hypothetical protein DVH24_039893 [Malus domestica]
MSSCFHGCVFLLAMVVFALSTPCLHALRIVKTKTRTSVFVSPKFVLGPGSVADKYYYNIDFPRGHISIKSFNGRGSDSPSRILSPSLGCRRYYGRIGFVEPEEISFEEFQRSDFYFVEYDVEESCSANSDACIDSQSSMATMPTGGYVVYGVAHQHTGGIGSTLYGEVISSSTLINLDGRVLCSSIPIYGKGKEAGHEAGYIVGMSTCYPQPGSVKINDGETLTLVSNYSSAQTHTGVMDLFYILVADYLPKSAALSLDTTL